MSTETGHVGLGVKGIGFTRLFDWFRIDAGFSNVAWVHNSVMNQEGLVVGVAKILRCTLCSLFSRVFH